MRRNRHAIAVLFSCKQLKHLSAPNYFNRLVSIYKLYNGRTKP
jgi:hypothetical protein